MQIRPVLAALRHHKAGTLLIAAQIALTLAIICNALFIIHERLARLSQPSGIDESSLLVIGNEWVGKPTPAQIASLMAADLDTLRKVPGVANVYATNSYPLSNGGMVLGVGHSPDKLKYVINAATYFADENTLSTLGLKSVEGRNFRPNEIGVLDGKGAVQPAEVIITRALATQMFPHASAIGKPIYVSARPSIVIGVVDRLRTPFVDSSMAKWSDCSVLVPYRQLTPITQYVVRAQPRQLDAVSQRLRAALYAVTRMRVISPKDGVRSFAQVREAAYRDDRGMAILMGGISVVLLLVTGAGIVGLSSFWVGQRRKQIGVRRALGATRRDILSYFLTENLLIAASGVAVGGVLAIGLNLWLMKQFEMDRLGMGYVLGGVVALLLLGQGAVLAPALRASRVSPVEATRSV
ncbi:MAG TPA: FtsX-like permease family protein [Dyella sp.]|uniref:ABC transporter permease n=1 Tax=Dyella sp. TaxID=1869338 RepID=UPI002CB2DFA5|nr:FtsX-like permease family protein [Dyella sp.]HUB91991.1 FtsX-like permease family protein [Dyella sp.]